MPLKNAILTASTVLVILILCLTVILLLPDSSTDQPADITSSNLQYLFDLNHIDHITKLSFTYQTKSTISLTKETAGWQVSGRAGLPISAAAMEDLLYPLEQILALRIITEQCTNIAEYSLDTPILKLTLSEKNSSKTYLFGAYNSHFSGYYCMVEGTKAVYLLDENYLLPYDVDLSHLLRTEQMPALALPPSIGVTDSNGESVELSNEEIAKLSDLLSQTKIERLIDYGTDKYAAYGLDHPTIFTTTREDGTPLTLRFAKGETDELLYLTLDEKELIYLVTCEDMAGLLSYLQ